MSKLENLFHHYANDIGAKETLFLLHGTGGSETDLLPLVEPFAQTHNVVGLLGNIHDDGMARFFRRQLADGTFDQENIHQEAVKVRAFAIEWCNQSKNASIDRSIFIGYSNGANMVLVCLFLFPQLITRAALLHPTLLFEPEKDPDLSQHQFLVSYGVGDPLISAKNRQHLLKTLQRYGINLSIVQTADHSIASEEVAALHTFISESSSNKK